MMIPRLLNIKINVYAIYGMFVWYSSSLFLTPSFPPSLPFFLSLSLSVTELKERWNKEERKKHRVK